MKQLPEVGISAEPLAQILSGVVPAKLLLSAIELNVFSHLAEPLIQP